MLTWIAMLGVALAGPQEDLALASQRPPRRPTAWRRLSAWWPWAPPTWSFVSRVSQDDAADARQRWVAVRSLGQIKGDRARNILMGLVSDPMPAIRAAAAAAMGDYGHDDFGAPLIGLIQDPAVIVRASAAKALSSPATSARSRC